MINSKINKKDLNIEEEKEIVEDIENDLDEQEDDDEEEEPIQAPKKKKVLNENQRKAVAINLAKGRENLKKKQEQQRIEREQRKEEFKKSKRRNNFKKSKSNKTKS